jgi:hypothetical protein
MTDLDRVCSSFPLDWIEQADIERLAFERATWIPILVERHDVKRGRFGTPGYRAGYRDFDSIIVPLAAKEKFASVDWQSVSRNNSDTAWADDNGFYPPGSYNGDANTPYPVIQRSFDTDDPSQWDLLQELEVGLRLLRRGDTWIAPDEDDIEVARLERDADGHPDALLFRAEHLRDYLCAKKAALLLVGFVFRDAAEESFPELDWKATKGESRRKERHFEHGWWEGTLAPMHEGGQPFGATMHVIHARRESVDPSDDNPTMPDPADDWGMKHTEFTKTASGRKLFGLSGRIWIKHWILPAQKSPRIRRDVVESRVHFQVENQERATLAGEALHKYRGWLYFKPSVVRRILATRNSKLTWYTSDTGELGPAPHATLHFGVNKLGLVNVLGYKMAQLPEWAQQYWATDNVCPEGGLSQELHMSQNLGEPAHTFAPEVALWENLGLLQGLTIERFGRPLLKHVPSKEEFFHRIHRFYSDSFADVCTLCKELHRIVSEPIDLDLLNETIDPDNAKTAKERKLGQIKRLAMWLDGAGLDGRSVTSALAGVYDLRISDAHITSTNARDALKILKISPDTKEYEKVCYTIVGLVANCIGSVAKTVRSSA